MINHDKPRGLGKLGAISASCGQGRPGRLDAPPCAVHFQPAFSDKNPLTSIDDVSYS